MPKRKSYDVSFNWKDVECIEKKSKEVAEGKNGIDSKRICNWSKPKGCWLV